MTSFASAESKNTIGHIVKQASNEQDFATSGTSKNELFKYLVIADTHGSGLDKHMLRELFKSLDWSDILEKDNFFEIIQGEIKKHDTYRQGSTLSICKIYEDKFENYWAGDSTIKIYQNGNVIWRTEDHDYNNDENIRNLNDLEQFKRFREENDVVATSSTCLKQVKAKKFYFGGEFTIDAFNMTHCLGHNQVSGDYICHDTVMRAENTDYKVVAGSDGFWQVMCESDNNIISSKEISCADLADIAYNRWRQEWTFTELSGKQWEKIKFPGYNIDDVALACWSN
tara:strand:+ start:5537 stop:6388 length:852 start_codon:yes stop_codon:yes gene_type:complete